MPKAPRSCGRRWYYYYNNNIIDNTRRYLYGQAPLLRDVVSYVPLFNDEVFLTPPQSPIIDEMTLLLYVLPYEEHAQIIPPKFYNKISKNVYHKMPLLKETNYHIDYLMCKYFWESHLELVHIDIFKLNDVVLKTIEKLN